jgi:hypothetical protein
MVSLGAGECTVGGGGWRHRVRTGWPRVLIAAVIPVIIGLPVWLSISFGVWSSLLQSAGARLGCLQDKMGCLGYALIGLPVLVIGLAVLAGALMRLAGVRPAWPVAAVGPVTALVVGEACAASPLPGVLTLPGLSLALVLAVSYAAAAVLTAPGVSVWVRIGVGVALTLLALSSLAGHGVAQPAG